MTDWADRQSAVQDAKLRTFGEPVRLSVGADGEPVDLVGVVDLYAEESQRRPRASDVPLGTPQQPRPVVYLLAADAEAVAVRSELTARGQVYLAVAKDTDDGGLVRIELMRKPADADATQYGRWQ
jgi:hypothetical protein